MRSYLEQRGLHAETIQQFGLGYAPPGYQALLAWLKREVMTSRATWNVIAADMPLGLVVYYDAANKWGVEAIAQGYVAVDTIRIDWP